MNDRPTPLAELLDLAFPDHSGFPPGCWVRRALATNYDGRHVGDAVEVVRVAGKREALVQRLQAEHPSGRLHREGHDVGVRNALTEAEAFAWAVRIARLGPTDFIMREGAPDLRTKAGEWIEAKTIRGSDLDRLAWKQAREEAQRRGGIPMRIGSVQDLSPGLVNKFDSQFGDALRKWERQDPKEEGLVVFYCLAALDSEVDWDQAWSEVQRWATDRAVPGTRVVVAWNHGWSEPRIDVKSG